MISLLILVAVCGFYAAWNIGANDVANAVGTSVGSGALTLKQAVLIAAIFEFSGAFLLGGNVVNTIENRIVQLDSFSNNMSLYIYGMISALLSTSVWLQVASFFGWPVSTTHSIIGAVIGFGLVVGKGAIIYWHYVLSIVLSWIISPILGGIIAFMIFSIIRKKVFHNKDPILAMVKLTPILSSCIFVTLTGVILIGGFMTYRLSLLSMCLLLCILGCLAYYIALFFIKRTKNLNKSFSNLEKRIQEKENYNQEHLFIEKIFAYFQIIIACFMAFAHGSNDVANAIAPVSAVFTSVNKSFDNKVFFALLLAGGGLGIVIGLATWGWRVIETVGCKITELNPSRGFSAGFGAALTIVLASKLGLPISTTHVIIGAVIGVGFARGTRAINLNIVKDIFISWIVTVPAGAILSIFFFFILRAIFGY